MKHLKEKIPSLKAARNELSSASLVLDLKTEGRYWRTSKITGLFLIYPENSEVVEEVFLPEKEADEYDLLVDAARRFEGPGALFTYNGDSFALPHLQKKYEAYRLPVPFTRRTSVDLLKKLRTVKDLLGLPSRKLSDIAYFLANAGCSVFLSPDCLMTSGKCPPSCASAADTSADTCVYSSNVSAPALSSGFQMPIASPDSSVFADDARRVFAALAFLPVLRFLEGGFSVQKAIFEDALLLSLTPNDALPFPFSVTFERIVLSANEHASTLLLPVENGSVRFYYPDYKNYDYLPAEGYAVHKSVSAYVAKDRKQPATPETSFAFISVNSLLENPKNLKTLAKNAISFLFFFSCSSPKRTEEYAPQSLL
ncbi:MAG: ribonuclease H-like domain-containing protein [Lachnospiraceae bacterium]